MPVITVTPYANKRHLTAFDVSQFVKVTQASYILRSTGDAFYRYQSAVAGTTPATPAAIWTASDARQGLVKVSTTVLPTSGDWAHIHKNHTTGRLMMVPSSDSNNNDNTFMYSDDNGVTWIKKPLPFSLRWNSLGEMACNNNNVVMVTCNYVEGTTTYAKTVRSLDGGTTWADITTKYGSGGGSRTIHYVERLNMWLTGYSTGIRYSTDDGNTWQQSPSTGTPYIPGHAALMNFVDTGDRLVCFIRSTTPGQATIRTSVDGITWDSIGYDVGETTGPVAIAYGAGLFVFVHSTYRVYTSTDLVNWSMGQLPTGSTGTVANNVVFANNQFVVTGASNYLVYQV